MSLIILIRVVLSVSASAIQKRLLLDGASARFMWVATYGLMLLPSFFLIFLSPRTAAGSFWTDILLGGFLDAAGNLAMVSALRITDLSLFGPLNALRPILAMFVGWIFLNETPSASGAAGIAISVGGAILLFRGDKTSAPPPPLNQMLRMLALRVSGLALSTLGAVFLKRAAVQSSTEMTLFGWIACGLIGAVALALARGRSGLAELPSAFKAHSSWIVLHAVVFLVMQWQTIRIFQHTLLAYSFVFFQLGMVLQVIVGRVLFKEPAFGTRLAGSIILAAGSGLILWKG